MTACSWNDDEDLAMDYVPWEAQVLYLRGLRRFMDYTTGIVGISRKLSRKGLIEVLEVHPEPGSHRERVVLSPRRVRSILQLLQRAALIERVKGYEQQLVFRLPLATSDQSDSRRSVRGASEERPTRSAPDFSNEDNELEDRSVRGASEERPTRSAPHPLSGIRNIKDPIGSLFGKTPAALPNVTDLDEAKLNNNRYLRKQAREVLQFLNDKAHRNYQPVDANLDLIVSRLKEGYTLTHLRQVIVRKCRDWQSDEKMAKFMRPKTLFNRTNFSNYAGELVIEEEKRE